MAGEWLFLLVGVALALTGALAGRLRMGQPPRIAIAGVGMLCVVAASILLASEDPRASVGPVRVTIVNELGPDQVREKISVFLDGRNIGVLEVDERSPRARVTATVAKTGRYDYRLVARSQVTGRAPTEVSHEDDVFIDADGRLDIYYDDEGRTYLGPPP